MKADGSLPDTFPALCAANAQAAEDRVALVDSLGSRRTYGTLYAEARALGRGMRELGVAPGSTVALLALNSVEWVTTVVAAHLAGATVAAFHTWVKARDLEFLLAHSEADTLVVASRAGGLDLLQPVLELVPELEQAPPGQWASGQFPFLRRVIVLGSPGPVGSVGWADVGEIGVAATARHDDVVVSGDEVALVLYTSGSTAAPKAVPLKHRDLVRNGFHIGERMALSERDKVWLGSPLFWSFGSANALQAAFTHQATLVLQEKFEADGAAHQILGEGCTAAYLLPALVHAFAALPDAQRVFQAVRTGLTIGRPDEVELAATVLGVEGICNVYGSTETYGNCCVTPHDMPLPKRLVCQGPPLPGMDLRVVDEGSGALLSAGEEGMVEVRGRVCPGYWKAPEMTAKAFTAGGWYKTGDVGYLDDEGCFVFVTRKADMIKTSGINVSPAEVEAFLLEDRRIAEAVVVGAPDPVRSEVVVAFVRPAPGATLRADEVMARCRRGIASYKVPREVRVVSEMPQTATGKLARKELRAMLAGDVARYGAASGSSAGRP